MQKLRLDNSRRSTHTECAKKDYWRNVRKLVPKIGSTPLRFGLTWHDIVAEYYKSFNTETTKSRVDIALQKLPEFWKIHSEKAEIWYDDYREPSALVQMFINYIDRYNTDVNLFTIKDVEVPIEAPINNWLTFVGRADLIVELSGQPYIADHKTTGQYIKTAVKRMQRTFQPLGYAWGYGQMTGNQPVGSLTFVCHCSRYKRKDGTYGKLKTDFERMIQAIEPTELEIWKEAFIETGLRILSCEKSGIWPQNFDNCYKYNKACEYMPLCRYGDSRPNSLDNYMQEETYDPTK